MNAQHPLTREALTKFCSGNEAAVELILQVWNVAEVYDDQVDRDGRAAEDEVHKAWAFALFGLHANPVILEHPALMLVLMQTAALWRAANALERRRDETCLEVSHTLRCSPYGFFTAVVLCVSGMEAAVSFATALYSPNESDTLASYIREHTS